MSHLIVLLSLLLSRSSAFVGFFPTSFSSQQSRLGTFFMGSTSTSTGAGDVDEVLSELSELAFQTGSGFRAAASERARMKELVDTLSASPTKAPEPANCFYPAEVRPAPESSPFTLRGRWKLIYTDAPDITGLAAQAGPLGELARVGQECGEDSIANVITWQPRGYLRGEASPSSSFSSPFERPRGTAEGAGERFALPSPPPLPSFLTSLVASDALEQRVCLKATAEPSQPARVNLFVDGIDLVPKRILGVTPSGAAGEGLSLRGPFSGSLPFGSFDVLYLDATLRVVRTVQGYLAINVRDERDDAGGGSDSGAVSI